jgi:hypothetical protein
MRADGEAEWQDMLVADGADQESMIVEASELEWRRDLLAKGLEALNERERHIVKGRRLRDEAMTLADLGHIYGVSRERVPDRGSGIREAAEGDAHRRCESAKQLPPVRHLRSRPRVFLVLVKKARDLLLQFRRVARLTHGNGVFEKLPLDGCRQVISLQKDRRPKALQDTLLFLREGHGFVAAWFFRCWPRRTSFAFPSGKGAGQRIARLTSLWCLGDHACNMGCGRVRRHRERGAM